MWAGSFSSQSILPQILLIMLSNRAEKIWSKAIFLPFKSYIFIDGVKTKNIFYIQNREMGSPDQTRAIEYVINIDNWFVEKYNAEKINYLTW